LSIQDDSLQFQQNGKLGAKVKIAWVRDVFLGVESKQVGGLPMTLGKTAARFGGGRVVSLFAHKKYDTLTLEYVDDDHGIHGAIFQLAKGQGEFVKSELMAAPDSTGSRISPSYPVRDCHKVFDMSSRTNSSDISISTVSCMRTDCIYRVLNVLKQIAWDALGLDSTLQFK
jgi:hypothetical protein